MNTLPDKPSELLRVALNDLHQCEKDPAYRIDMVKWHRPIKVSRWWRPFSDPMSVCFVCLAGAVMAKTLRYPPEEDALPGFILMLSIKSPSDIEKLPVVEKRILHRKLMSLDLLRNGYVKEAFTTIGLDAPIDIPYEMHIRQYHLSPRAFYKDMWKLVKLLEQHGY